MRNSPGAKAQTLGELLTMARKTPMPTIVRTKPAMMRLRWARRFANRSAPSDVRSRPTVAAVKITPVSIAS